MVSLLHPDNEMQKVCGIKDIGTYRYCNYLAMLDTVRGVTQSCLNRQVCYMSEIHIHVRRTGYSS
jgi:hypothetical protein